jgi:hypothetical protein
MAALILLNDRLVATAAYQTLAGEVSQPEHMKPFQLDKCHALMSNGPVVAQYYARWHTGQREDDLQSLKRHWQRLLLASVRRSAASTARAFAFADRIAAWPAVGLRYLPQASEESTKLRRHFPRTSR